jgi:formylmethanofuran dehydrogenase subunit C
MKQKPLLRAEDLFDNLQPEEKQPETRKIEVVKSERLEEIVRGFEKYFKIFEEFNWQRDENKISGLFKIIPTSKEILDFSILINEYQYEDMFKSKAGIYLSALINKSDDKEIIITTDHLEKFPSSIGYKNYYKTIRINNNTGNFLGSNMQGGKIFARTAKNHVGYKMKGGIIHLDNAGNNLGMLLNRGKIYVKNAGDCIGWYMKAGTIYVENTGEGVGYYMQGGTIHIENTYQSLSDEIHGGNIYHQGRLIVKDGVKLI